KVNGSIDYMRCSARGTAHWDCYNQALMPILSLQNVTLPSASHLPTLLRDWREDTMSFLRHDAPKIVFVVLVAYLLTRILRAIARKTADLQIKKVPSGMRVQQIRTLTSVTTSVGVFVILFTALLMVLSVLALSVRPMLASARIARLASGFGAH